MLTSVLFYCFQMDINHIRHVMLFLFDAGLNGTEAASKICEVYGADAINMRTCQRWFSRFKNGDRSLEEMPRSGRPSLFNDDQLRTLVEAEPKLTVRELGDRLQQPFQTVHRHLLKIGKVSLLIR